MSTTRDPHLEDQAEAGPLEPRVPAPSRRLVTWVGGRRRLRALFGVVGAFAVVLLAAGCDTMAPSPTTGLSATPTSTSVTLNWANPTDVDFTGSMVRVRAGAIPPATASEGALVAEVAAPATTVVAPGLSPSTTYSFAVFAHDKVPNHAPGATVTVSTAASGLTCSKNWNGPANGSFAIAANWSPSGVPTATDTVCAGTGATIVSSANQTVAATQIAGKLTLTNGTFALAGTGRPNTIAELFLDGGRQQGDVVVSSKLVWTSGSMTGVGTTTVAKGATADLLFNSIQGSLSYGHVLANHGELILVGNGGTSASLLLSAQLDNYGTVTTSSAGAVIGNSGVLNNKPTGVLTIDPGTGKTTTIGSYLNNAGTIDIKTGTLVLSRSNSTNVVDTGVIKGAGSLRLTADRTFAAGATLTPTDVAITNGTTTFTGQTITRLSLAGGAQSGDVVVSSTLVWTSGSMSGTGTTTIAKGATADLVFTLHQGSLSYGHVLANHGDITLVGNDGTSVTSLLLSAQLDNYGTVTTRSAGAVIGNSGVFTNKPSATLTIDPGTGKTTTIGSYLNNAGTIDMTTGTLVLSRSNSTNMADTGVIKGAGSLRLTADRTFAAGATLTPTDVAITNGTTTFTGQTITRLSLAGGAQSGDVVVSSTLVWTSGSMTGAGTTTVAKSATADLLFNSIQGSLSYGHVLANHGSLTLVGNGGTTSASLLLSAQLDNYGTITTRTQGLVIGNSGVLNNKPGATLTIDPGTGHTTTIGSYLNNAGTIDITSGALVLARSNSTNVADTGVIKGAGSLTLTADRTFAAGATVTPTEVAITNGTTTFTGQTIARLALAGGAQQGDVVVSSKLVWTSGSMTGAGTTTVAKSATAELTFTAAQGSLSYSHVLANHGSLTLVGNGSNSSASMLLNAQLDNYGTITTRTPGLVIGNSGVLNNKPGATLTIDPGTGHTTTIGSYLNNAGTIHIASGTLEAPRLATVL